jgi:large subunit ribosomal protein L23
MKDPREIIIRPILTEKSVHLTAHPSDAIRSERQGVARKYTFEVAPEANKVEIRGAIEALFQGTQVGEVNTMMVQGKVRRMGGYGRRRRQPGRTARWKKAVVTLRAGTIPAFEGL